MELSLLDLVPVRVGQSTADALASSHELVRAADRLGFTRYWVAEHHNMPSVASTMPGAELMYLGQGTERIRLGSGGVMLPNHAPLAVAELFALLSAVYGDRVDLGIGRAPGTDPITSAAMRGHLGEGRMVDREGKTIDPVEQFPQHVIDTLSLMTPEGVRIPLHGGREHVLRATPAPVPGTQPLPWLLGSSGYSARLAAELGMPYVFANHFAAGATTAMKIYRDNFSQGAYGAEPRTFVTANAVVASTDEEARLRSEPFLLQMARLRTGGQMGPLRLVGADVRSVMTDQERMVAEELSTNWIIGDPKTAAAQLQELADRFEVDEIMIQPVTGSTEDEDLRADAARIQTLELLASELLR
ncbi:luciferase family oxidoreductase group 1 [Brevibacterium sanguinis]|uniref:Luciferase family oxidoreductase group 1 n=2 Tax=Brevibacterium TaxID=1696 RepID=A0A366IJC8_9MICO|nr:MULTISPECIES: LLM class flavin-dependent oxidoreductase [Brevibacterium]RBP65596.1 luciferase family oxidoreductase group 1 [Brevibacterium sanguinis]RBP72230.1 luciferase family oxidoreductase group 1 [Brevibacterium celere]